LEQGNRLDSFRLITPATLHRGCRSFIFNRLFMSYRSLWRWLGFPPSFHSGPQPLTTPQHLTFYTYCVMSPTERFVSRLTSIEQAPSLFLDSFRQHARPYAFARHLAYSPEFITLQLRTLASLLCVTARRWFAVAQDGPEAIAEEASFGATALVECMVLRLYGQLNIDFVSDKPTQSPAVFRVIHKFH
jgi:hypothetical protein